MMRLERVANSDDLGSTFYVLFTVVVALISYLLYKRQQKIHPLDLLPGPKTLPFIGNAWEFIGGPTEYTKAFMEMCMNPCGLTRIWFPNKPMCVLYKASKVEAILSSQKFIDKSTDYVVGQQWLRTGLLTSTGAKWHRRRKILTSSFHFKILEDFVEIFNQQSNKFISILEEKADGTPFNIYPKITLCTLDIILESTMGISINAQGDTDSKYVKAVSRIGTIMIQRQLKPWLQPDFLFKLSGYATKQEECLTILHGFTDETIKERRKQYQLIKNPNIHKEENEVLGKRKHSAFLDLLLEHEDGDNPLSDEDIREEVDTFMFAGHDTTAAAINWTIYLLGIYPEIQKKMCEELSAIFGDSDRPATSDDLRGMKYLECCIKETLRLFPSAPIIGRLLNENVTLDGYTIPSGTDIYINFYSLHRDPQYFPDPEEFKPERFFPENSEKRHPYAYIPFSAGPRNCIGQKFAMMELKVVVSSLFRKFRVESVEKREEIKLTADMILRPQNGTHVKIYPRK